MGTRGSSQATGHARTAWSVVQALLTGLAVLILFGMMLLTSVDVIARYVFNSPVRGAFELIEIGLAMLVYLAMPVATVTGSHIAVELLAPPRARPLRLALALTVRAAIAVTFALIAWQVWLHAQKISSYGQVTNSLEIPLGLVAFIAAFGAGLAGIAAFLHTEQNEG